MKLFILPIIAGTILGFLPPKSPPPDVTAICTLRGETPTQEAEVSVFVTSTYDDAHDRALGLITSKVTGVLDERGFYCGYEQVGIVKVARKQ